MQQRILSTEMEYGLLVKPGAGVDFHNPDDQDNYRPRIRPLVDRYTPGYLKSINDFYSNGSRLYVDVGTHIEYCGPEDITIEGAVANEIAGERIVSETLDNAKQANYLADYRLNKRVIDDEGTTWGHHENYLAPNSILIRKDYIAIMGLHLATINLFTGSGVVISPRAKEPLTFAISQKSLGINCDYSSDTTKDKPVINLRMEAHSDQNKWTRVHVTSGDANMSPWAMRMRLGTTALVLRLIENGYKAKHFDLDISFCQVMRQVALDTSLKKSVKLKSGKSIRPLNIQERFISAIRQLSETSEIPEEELDILSMWEQAHADLERDPALLADRADWVAKKQILESYMDRHDSDWQDPIVAGLDKKWDELSPDGYGLKLRETRWKQWMPPDELIAKRQIMPPDSTRAAIRGKYIRLFADKNNSSTVNWSYIRHEGTDYQLRDPFATKDKAVDRIINP